jgi:hypothetical protein
MYKLLKPVPNGLGLLVDEVQHHITNIGLEAVKGLKGDNVSFLCLFFCVSLIFTIIIFLRFQINLLNKCWKFIANIQILLKIYFKMIKNL